MFKKTESATMELECGCHDLKIIQNCFMICNQAKIERFIINIDDITDRTIEEIKQTIDKNESISTFLRISLKNYSKLKDQLSDVCCIITIQNESDQNNFIEYLSDSSFFEIEFRQDISKSLFSMSNIIWSIPFYDWESFDKDFNHLLNNCTSDELMIKQEVLSTVLIKEHPCNVYLCSGDKCHSQHGNFPRYIYVSATGDMYPYEFLNEKYRIGNVINSYSDTFSIYDKSKEKANFIALNRNLYLDIMDKCTYSYIPWFDVLRVKTNEN